MYSTHEHTSYPHISNHATSPETGVPHPLNMHTFSQADDSIAAATDLYITQMCEQLGVTETALHPFKRPELARNPLSDSPHTSLEQCGLPKHDQAMQDAHTRAYRCAEDSLAGSSHLTTPHRAAPYCDAFANVQLLQRTHTHRRTALGRAAGSHRRCCTHLRLPWPQVEPQVRVQTQTQHPHRAAHAGTHESRVLQPRVRRSDEKSDCGLAL